MKKTLSAVLLFFQARRWWHHQSRKHASRQLTIASEKPTFGHHLSDLGERLGNYAVTEIR